TMSQLHYTNIPRIFTSLLYICGFFIFLEWLYPVKQITDTDQMYLFIIFAIFCFCISLFEIGWWQQFVLKGLGMLLFIHLLFFEGSIFEFTWLNEWFQEVIYNFERISAREWDDITPI